MVSAIATLWAAGCAPTVDSGTVFVEVQTDWIPGEEMRSVRVTLAKQSDPDRTLATEASGASGGPAEERAFRTGLRIAEFGRLAYGSYQIVIELRDPTATVFATRMIRFQLVRDALAVQAVLTRDCGGVSCPGGGAPELTECFGARCVDPRCRPGSSEHCPVPACTAAADCSPTAPCATTACESGACLYFGDSSECTGGDICDPDEGCREPRPAMPDAGVDTSPPDVGMDTSVDTGPTFDPNGDPDLIMWAPMNEASALTDSVVELAGRGIAIRCSSSSCPTTNAPGQRGTAFDFDGTRDRLRIVDAPALVTTAGFTLAIWARVPAVPITRSMVLLSKPFGGSFRNSWELGFVDVDSDGEGELSFVVDSGAGEATASTEHGLPGGTWSHVAAVWEPGSRRLLLYLDGALVNMSAESVTPSFDSSDGFIGADDNGSIQSFFAGHLDDARIYQRALTAEEIRAVMTAPNP